MKKLFDDDQPENESQDFARLFEGSLKGLGQSLQVGNKIRGEVLSVGKEEVFFSTGTVHDGWVPKVELLNSEGQLTVQVGDFVDLYVVQVKGSDIRLSAKPGAQNLAEGLEDAFDMMLPIEGRVTEVVNGGYRVQVEGKLAFCPFSQIDLRRSASPEEHLQKKYQFLITQFTEGGRNIVLSRRKLLEEEKEQSLAAFQEDVKPGQIVSGKVTRLEPFGAFMELAPGVEGLVHISEISWSRLKEPAEGVQVGQMVQAKVLRVEDQGGGRLRVSLSIKQAGEEPWTFVSQNFPVGSSHVGTVTRRENFGLFVELAPGVTALLPKSKAVEVPNFSFDKTKVGEQISVQIAEIDYEGRRMQVGPTADPDANQWRSFQASNSTSSMGTLADQFQKALQKSNRK